MMGDNVITGVIHNESIQEVGIPESMLNRFLNIRLLGFGIF